MHLNPMAANMKLADLKSASFFENPYPTYAALRAEGPIVPLAPNMVVTGHYDVIDALLHDRRVGKAYLDSIRVRYGEDGPNQPVFQSMSRMMFAMNPPVHTHVRGLMMKAFNARQIEAIRDIAQTTANRLIDTFVGDETVELIEQYALPLPVEIICGMLDVPVEDASKIADATREVTRALDPAPLQPHELALANDASETMDRYFKQVIEARRTKPGDDLISMLLSVEERGVTLTDDEIVSNVVLLFGAGHETTSNMIGNMLIALHRHPEQLALLKREPSKLSNAVFECLRYDSSVQTTVRTALEDVEIGGTTLPRDTVILLMLGSANRDPAKFKDPGRLNIERDEARLQTFGAGIHHCLGYRLALLELETALRSLLERLPNLQLTNLDDLRWRERGNLRGVEALTASW
jgi:cytochrome P450